MNNIKGFSPITTWAINDISSPFLLTNFDPDACTANCTIPAYNIFPGRKLPYLETTITYEGTETMVTEKETHFDSKPEHF